MNIRASLLWSWKKIVSRFFPANPIIVDLSKFQKESKKEGKE